MYHFSNTYDIPQVKSVDAEPEIPGWSHPSQRQMPESSEQTSSSAMDLWVGSIACFRLSVWYYNQELHKAPPWVSSVSGDRYPERGLLIPVVRPRMPWATFCCESSENSLVYTSLRGAGFDNLTEKAFYYRHYINIHFMEEEAGYSEQLSQRHFLSRKVPKQAFKFF